MSIPFAGNADRPGIRRRLHRLLSRWGFSEAGLRAVTLALLASSACAPAPYQPVFVDNRCSLHLDGKNDHLDLGRIEHGNPLMLAGSPFTLSAWFLQEAGGDLYERILDKSDGPLASHGYALTADPGERRIHFYVHDGKKGGDFIGASRMFGFGAWHHVVAVARSDRLEIWLDGVRDRHTSYESGSHVLPADAVTSARIGDWNHDAGRAFKGWLDEVAVWNTDLPADAIEALQGASARADLRKDWGPYRFSRNLARWWRMEESSGDPSGQGGNAPPLDCTHVP